MADRKLLEVVETRVRDGRIEGLCRYDDGSEEWRAPDVVEATGTILRADGQVEQHELEIL